MSYMLSYQSIACNTLNTYVTDKKLSSLKLWKLLVIVEDYAMVVRIFFFFFLYNSLIAPGMRKEKIKKPGPACRRFHRYFSKELSRTANGYLSIDR